MRGSKTATREAPVRAGVSSTLLMRVEAAAPAILAGLLLLWVAVLFAASIYKYETFGQGYDQVDFEQAIWNTVQGRPMEDSRFNFTGSLFGMDWMPMLLFFVPFYALVPTPHVLFFLQIVGAGLGALPVFWLARDRIGSRVAGLGFATTYLLYPTLLHGVLNPFQVRLFAVTLLLFALYYFEKGNWQLFYAAALLAVLARTDVALVVAMFGVYGLLTRRSWQYVAGPLALGLAYFALSTFVIVPSFAYEGALTSGGGAVGEGYMACWPCGANPIIAYYGHLGRSGPEIVGYILTHPLEVAGIMLEPAKIGYLLLLLVPVAMLPILSLRPFVLGLPILALNMLSLREAQYSYQTHYSLLVMPGIFAAAIYGFATLTRLAEGQKRGRVPLAAGLLGLVLWAGAMSLLYKNPVVRAVRFPEPPMRVQAAKELIRMVPAEARVAASSKVAPHLLPRRYIYNFPPAPYSPYNLGPRRSPGYVDLDYILVDPSASALEVDANAIDGKTGLELLRELPEWREAASRQGFTLYERVR